MGFTKFLFQDLLGWKIQNDFSPEFKKSIIIVVPHTSWYDWFVAIFTRRILNTQINFVGKKELFVWPLGWYFRAMGGAPLDRTPGQNKVDSIAKIFDSKDIFRLAMSPEGTRKKVDTWKTGFYYIAQKANVPIICVSFDYPNKIVKIREPFFITNDIEKDMADLKSYFDGVIGKKADYS